MYRAVLLLVLIASCVSESFAKIAPPYINACPKLTPECLKNSIQEAIPNYVKGIPELGINPTDPLTRNHVTLDLMGGFKVEFYDGRVTGLRKCIVDSAKFENNSAEINLHCNVTIKGKYKANGSILIVRINGDGDAKIKAYNLILTSRINFEDRIRNGILYYDVKNFTVSHHYGDKVTFSLTNLFKGNPLISETVLTFLNTNWKQISEEFGSPVFDTIVNMVYNTIKKFFSVVPKNELFV